MTTPEIVGPDVKAPDPRRWKALAVLGLVQFMFILDITVVNVALPKVRVDLGFSQSGLAWVVNGYVLTAGGLLLLGGRLADMFGRRKLFLIGVGLFAVASATCGSATDPAMLVASRFVQGMGEALASPASLGLLPVLFPDPKERIKALGIWGGIAGLGGTAGSVLSGVITTYLSWRWIFFVNLPVAVFALIFLPRLTAESRMTRQQGAHRPDFEGAVTGAAGLIALVYGVLQAANHPWGSGHVLLPLFGGIALLLLMVFIEAHSPAPLIPLGFFKNRTRVVTNIASLLLMSGFLTYFFMMTLFEQQVLHYSPIRSGLSYLPFGVTIGAGIGLGTALMPRIGVRPLLSGGFILGAVGLLLTSSINPNPSYASHILPGMIVLALGAGLSFPAIGNASLHGVTGQDSSLASGVQNAMQQIGGALGLSTIVTIALRRASSQIAHGVPPSTAFTHGYVLGFRVGAVLLLVAGVLTLVLLERVTGTARSPVIECDAPVEAANPAA